MFPISPCELGNLFVFCGLAICIGADHALRQARSPITENGGNQAPAAAEAGSDAGGGPDARRLCGQVSRSNGRGDLKRLVEEGAWFRDAAYPYAATETCVGHSTISTGAFPATHGMVANAWWDREKQKMRDVYLDPNAKNSGYGRASVKGGDSAAADADARVCGGIEVSERRRHAGGDLFVEGTRGNYHGRPQGRRRDLV